MLEIYGLIFSIIIGTVGHFLYEISNNNKIIGYLFSTNESTWEHLKLGITPIIFWSLIEFILTKNPNIFVNVCLKIIIFCITVIILYYTYKHILKKNILLFDISIFYLSLAISYLINNKFLLENNYSITIYFLSFVFLTIIQYAYLNYSKNPPNNFLFKN